MLSHEKQKSVFPKCCHMQAFLFSAYLTKNQCIYISSKKNPKHKNSTFNWISELQKTHSKKKR